MTTGGRSTVARCLPYLLEPTYNPLFNKHDSARREDTPRLFFKGLADADLLLVTQSQALTV